MDTLHILTRVSSSIQETDGTSLKTQKEIGIELSKKLGMKFQLHNEGGISSSKETLDNRPIMLNLLQMMMDGKCKHLYVYNTDRISRGSTFYFIRKVMVENKVVLYTSTGRYDTSGTMENLILGILSEVSQYDNKVRSERSRLGKMEKVKLNYYRGGDTPFGYRLVSDGRGNKLQVDNVESRWVQFIFKSYNDGKRLIDIKHQLELKKVKTRRGNDHWSLGTLQLMLRNDTYLGIDEFIDKKSGLVIRNEIPSIISQKLFDEVQGRRLKILSRKGQMNRTKHDLLFRDFIFCKCGTPIGGRNNDDKNVHHYYCPLSERKFNKSVEDDRVCGMKRCVNIKSTDDFLWCNILMSLSDTIRLKSELKKGLFNRGKLNDVNLKRYLKTSEMKLNKLQEERRIVTNGLIDMERKNIRNEYPSEDVYIGLKSRMSKDLRELNIEIENTNQIISNIGKEDKWYQMIDDLGREITGQTYNSDELKKSLLNKIIDRIVLDHDPIKKVHHLDIHFRVPMLLGGFDGGRKSTIKGRKCPPKRLKSLGVPISPRSFHSTVTDLARLRG